MRRIRIIGLALVAVFAVGAIASASASAANDKCHENAGTEFQLCAEKSPTEAAFVELGSPEPTKFGTDGDQLVKSRLTGSLLGVASVVECQDIEILLTIEDSNKSTGTITFTSCKMIKPAGCKLSAAQEKEIIVPVVDELSEEGAGKIGDEFWGATGGPTKEGEPFVTLHIEAEPGKICLAPKEATISGSQWAEISNATVAKEHGEATALAANSEMTFGGNPATFETVGAIGNLEPLPSDTFGELWKVVKTT